MSEDIFLKVQQTLSEALGIAKTDIHPTSSIVRDLGAESIDFIDIIFRLEKTFDIKIPSGELFPGNIFTDERFVKEGKVTEAGLAELRSKVPYMDVDGFSRDPLVSKISDFFTVQMILNYLQDKISKKASV